MHGAMTPETVFNPTFILRNANHGAGASDADTEQCRYKRLINGELARQSIPLAHMADKLGLQRTKLHKVLRQGAFLSEDLRDQLFEELGIDHTRATIAVSMLKSEATYHDQAVPRHRSTERIVLRSSVGKTRCNPGRSATGDHPYCFGPCL